MSAALEFMCMFLASPIGKFESDYRTKSLYIARLVVKKGGNVHSRVDFKNNRFLIERWHNNRRIWVHPNIEDILNDHTAQLRKNLHILPRDFVYFEIDDRMPMQQ
jgi:hypothetical protein